MKTKAIHVNHTFKFKARVSEDPTGACSCGEKFEAYATATTATVRAILEPKNDDTFIADGDGDTETDELWDNQVTIKTEDNLPLLVCQKDHYYVNKFVKQDPGTD
jgi:hypothetical protein